MARTRNAFLVFVAALCLIVTGVVLAFPPGDGGMVLNHMMGPDNFTVRADNGQKIRYDALKNRDGSYLVKRNGAAWLTISHKNGVVEIRDPNGAPAVVIIKTTEKEH